MDTDSTILILPKDRWARTFGDVPIWTGRGKDVADASKLGRRDDFKSQL